MDNKVNEAIAPVDELLPPQQLFILGLQHVLAMCAGAVAVPLIVGGALNLSAEQTIFLINADLFVAGIATLVQSLGIKNFIGAKVPVIEGASFASVSAMLAIANTYPGDPITGITTIFGATFIAGLFCFIMAPFFGKLIRFFPKVVTGTVITIIGISLLPVAVRWCAGNDVKSPTFASPKNILLALFVLILILIMYKFFKGILGNISILLGIVVGTIVASMLGMSDFTRVHSSGWINIDIPLYFGALKFDLTAIISMILVMLVMMTEATGNMIAIHEMVGKDIDDKNLTRGLRTDGLLQCLQVYLILSLTLLLAKCRACKFDWCKKPFCSSSFRWNSNIIRIIPKSRSSSCIYTISCPWWSWYSYVWHGSFRWNLKPWTG